MSDQFILASWPLKRWVGKKVLDAGAPSRDLKDIFRSGVTLSDLVDVLGDSAVPSYWSWSRLLRALLLRKLLFRIGRLLGRS